MSLLTGDSTPPEKYTSGSNGSSRSDAWLLQSCSDTKIHFHYKQCRNICAHVALGYVTSHASLGGQKSEIVLESAALSDYVASLEPRPKRRYSENLAFVQTEPFLTRLVQSYSYTQQLVTTVAGL